MDAAGEGTGDQQGDEGAGEHGNAGGGVPAHGARGRMLTTEVGATAGVVTRPVAKPGGSALPRSGADHAAVSITAEDRALWTE